MLLGALHLGIESPSGYEPTRIVPNFSAPFVLTRIAVRKNPVIDREQSSPNGRLANLASEAAAGAA